MRRKRIRNGILLGCILSLLGGCSSQIPDGDQPDADRDLPVTENLFAEDITGPAATQPPLDMEKADASASAAGPAETPSVPAVKGGTAFGGGPVDAYRISGLERYRGSLYQGGEMSMTFEISTQGFSEEGVGFLLFVDGIAQPYRLDEESEYQYMQVYYPPDLEVVEHVTFHFIPVTGELGDIVEVGVKYILAPDLKPDVMNGADNHDFRVFQAMSQGPSFFLMEYGTTPPATEKLQGMGGLLSNVSITKEEFSERERKVYGWDEVSVDREVGFRFYIDGEDWTDWRVNPGFAVDGKDTAHLRLEMAGAPLAEYGVTFFLDYQEIISEEGPFQLDISKGQKTVVKADLDVSQIDDLTSFCIVMSPKNRTILDKLVVLYATQYVYFYREGGLEE